MKRFIFAIASTVAALYMVLGFKSTPVPDTVAQADSEDEASTPTTETEPETTLPPETSTSTTTTTELPSTQPTLPKTTTTRAPTTSTTTSTTQVPRKTFSGDIQKTDWGSVQVSITVQGKKIVAVTASRLPNDDPSNSAKPKLISETLQAQSANIATVSGATYTSAAWKKSLAAAIKSAGI